MASHPPPTTAEIAALIADVRQFVHNTRQARRTSWYGNDHTVFRFELSFCDDPNRATLNYIQLDWKWRRRGVFTALVNTLRAQPGMIEIAVKSAHTAEIQSALRTLGFEAFADDDYILCLNGHSRHRYEPWHLRIFWWLRNRFIRLRG